jgi:hypothetical protein
MPRKKNPPPAPVVAFTMATRTWRYGNTESNTQSNSPEPTQLDTQSNTQSNTPNLALDFTFDPTPDPDDNQSQFAPKRTKKVSLIWTDLMEETLFNELHRQDRLGKRANMGFKSKAWVVVRDTVQAV